MLLQKSQRRRKWGEKVNGGRERKLIRKIWKLVKKNKWYNKGGEEEKEEIKNKKKHMASNSNGHTNDEVKVEEKIKAESVIFIPYTPRSELKKKLQEWENMFSRTMKIDRIKFVEVGGTKIKNLVVKMNPWEGIDCNREMWNV